MPMSTTWKRRHASSINRGVSPVRPAEESIERLSPDPCLTSPTPSYHLPRSGRQTTNTTQLRGLGLGLELARSGVTGGPHTQPDHLYLDQDGGAHVAAKVRNTTHSKRLSDQPTRDERLRDATSPSMTHRSGKGRGHTRSGSTIDDLANIAIATSPQFDYVSPSYALETGRSGHGESRPATSYQHSYGQDSFERPAKRVKSERLRSAEWAPREDRPRGAHFFQSEVRTEDAELLLLFHSSSIVASNPLLHTSSEIRHPASAPLALESTAFVHPQPITQAEADSEVPDVGLDESGIEKKIKVPSGGIEHTGPNAAESADNHASNGAEHDSAVTDQALAKVQAASKAVAEKPAEPAETGKTVPGTTKPAPAPIPKKPRRVKTEVQAEVCAECNKLNYDSSSKASKINWVGCEACKRWFHEPCAGFKDRLETRGVDKFICKTCEPEHGKTTFVRKSSRAKPAIDYAGLNEGVVKTSNDTSVHHYVPKFRDGSISVLPDDFARVRPELMTAHFWENMSGVKRPFVVPASWNPRFGQRHDREDAPVSGRSASRPDSKAGQDRSADGDHEMKDVDSSADVVVGADRSEEEVLDVDQDFLDMVMPRDLTVRKVAELYGPEETVPVIDVKSQETKGVFTLEQWAEYYEDSTDKPIRNVISLEISHSRLGRLIRRPKAVRDIDLEDQVWDVESRKASNKRPVAFYCLMSVADSYTDFHIDFGGSSVYYHILKGVKTFFFIPPEDRYLKKYEEWCNSDTQNETWLGDLCNGNVTRVDLREGDTAFIPAGWIHSVWTPEDSLVIGGNFLTRYDIEMQLKVAHVEKVTKVSPKFRYPFFQKVMWYTLIKYLEDDPVPEEVLRDFQNDPNHAYVRAHPIWQEFVLSEPSAEPGDSEYNARVYSSSETSGLLPLQDYLYRTARIHADLPVEGINKKQIDAVKASIPKGHGDPMQLIKTFAVWCAWKLGNTTVPSWVHSDTGLQPEIEKRERERTKKPEVFRIPPERTSARQKSQGVATPPVEDGQLTPTRTQGEIDEDSAKKSSGGSRTSNFRLACEACRKKRVKCRHRDDAAVDEQIHPAQERQKAKDCGRDDSGMDETARQTLERPRSYSNVSVDVARLARASPILNARETPAAPDTPTPEHPPSSDLAQVALASLSSPSSDTNGLTLNGTTPGSAKKGRSKACEECRKSKRRCVHDEYGRVDPAKAAEPSKPRGSTGSKRPARTSDEYLTKRVKMEEEHELGGTFNIDDSDMDAMIDPALLGSGPPPDRSCKDVDHEMGFRVMTDANDATEPPRPMSPSNVSRDGEAAGDLAQVGNAPGSEQMQASKICRLVRPSSDTPDPDIGYSPITVDGGPTESIEAPTVEVSLGSFQNRGLRRSPRQRRAVEPVSTLSAKDVKSEPQDGSTTSPQDDAVSVESRRSSSNTSDTTHQQADASRTLAEPTKVAKEGLGTAADRSSTADSELGADERLARKLHAEEHGLRRRTSMRA